MIKKFILFITVFVLTFYATGQNSYSISKNRFSLGFNFSPDYTYRRLFTDQDDQGLIKNRNNLESPRLGFTGGFVVNYKLSKKLALESGIQIADKGEKYETTETDYVFLDGMDDPAVPDKEKTKYHYYYWGIPLKLNYSVLSGKTNIVFSAGVSADLFSNSTTYSVYTFPNKEIVNRSPYEIEGFNNITLVGLAGIGMSHDISKKLQLRFQPTFRYSFTPVIDSDLKGYMYSAGLDVTILYSR